MYQDRASAGRTLARSLTDLYDAVVLGLARGGVPVAAEVAGGLHAPLDVLVVRKLGAPWNPEFGFGAVGENGIVAVDDVVRHRVGVDDDTLAQLITEGQTEIDRRVARYRPGRSLVDVAHRTVILVDDGLATGSTAIAAVQVLRALGARRIVVAVPVGSRDAVERLRTVADDVVCLETPAWSEAVGSHSVDFGQITDDEVVSLLHGSFALPGDLTLPPGTPMVVAFAHGSGSSRFSPRNREVSGYLNARGLDTFLFDLLTEDEAADRTNVFDIDLLATRVVSAIDWLQREHPHLAIGLFGASTGAAAALVAASRRPEEVVAVVSRGGRPDLAGDAPARVTAPTLLIVGGRDYDVIGLNSDAARQMLCEHRIEIVPGATHLFEEPGTLNQVSALAADWFRTHVPEPAVV
ncbi:MAG: phosphoribosyltransferase [Actinobacteria bacterium]|nr:phosphoribosyltransferase [Actinomycetota bacterium]